ncbi:uncharacterized protein PGTG_18074 [Puccinia graminis f. sp. tritici CRL 75-36-700-3]|uniref:Tc1-like transposase DDE domain-containing protein n=1 Tax=Puccinia graminis f. sp. tritici (strain CRL 75-36-700-3 / race SCCL) TaxID=418459 RepID=E3L5Q5_PUCGT|nr:uncharacterized protein PGTG_18074 [Puccinia graminis f. sp. tritici CRL 75-36-700-3]EFP91880.2 hypothetical protein PGTG_18074 [Puccinia graminis f. sp. tritici CRL 75-36-700-3]
MSKSNIMDPDDLDIESDKQRARDLAEELRALNQQTFQRERNNHLTHKECKPNAIIKPEVRNLIRENVVGNAMKISDAMQAYKVSQRQIQRIKAEDPNLVKTHKKHPSKFTGEMKTELLFELDTKSTTTLAKMEKFLNERFSLKVSTQAISNLIHDMDISWKQVTNIPASWNKPGLIEQQANFDLIFTLAERMDTLPLGQPAVLSLVPKAKQVTLIGALSEEGFVYHELLNADNTKAKGVGSDEFCLFLGSLGARLPQESIIIMDNAPIHQGNRFEEVKKSLDDSKSIKIEFLPPYSPFLNPIEYSFHSIKSYVRSKEPPNQATLVTEIKKGIDKVITPEKSQNFFSHCQRLYCPCAEFQEITGPVLSAPSE